MRRSQTGYLLLAMLIPTGGLAALSLLGLVAHSEPGRLARESRDRLLAARHALIAYAVGYIDLYGPGGAGPGHLPCPDTDAVVTTAGQHAAAGPNPPCGTGRVAIGRLPAGVTTDRHRYRFARHDAFRPYYAVSTAFINNPVNRPVNPELAGALRAQGYPDVAAMLFTADRAAANRGAGLPFGTAFGTDIFAVPTLAGWRFRQRVLIRYADIIEPATRRVATWMFERLQISLRDYCKAFESSCRLQRIPCAHQGAGSALVPERRTGRITGWAMVHWLTDEPLVQAAHRPCAAAVIEATPASRHWFVRNGWHRFSELILGEACFDDLSLCELQLAPVSAADYPLTLQLIPREARSIAAGNNAG